MPSNRTHLHLIPVDAKDATAAIRGWLDDENLEYRVVDDGKATLHLHVKYPPTKDGHVFNIVIPKKRLLVLVYSITRVDQGQQDEMVSYREEDLIGWKGWLHEIRMHLTRSTLDWVLHVGKEDEQNRPGPLQAFNISRPIWFDGLTQNELMQTMRGVWLTKLSIIHQIKFDYGKGIGKPGPVDDWKGRKPISRSGQKSTLKSAEVDFDEQAGFGQSFDPSEWV